MNIYNICIPQNLQTSTYLTVFPILLIHLLNFLANSCYKIFNLEELIIKGKYEGKYKEKYLKI